jgi:hypothetical protein
MSTPTTFSLTISPASGVCPLLVTFTFAGLTKEISRVLLRYGDGLETNEIKSTHIYRAAGTYSVYAYVWFSDGTASSSVYVDAVEVFEWDIVHTGLDGSLTDMSYSYATNSTQGEGFSKNTGDAWPKPEAEVGVKSITDDLDNYHLLVWDSTDGFFYDITTRQGAAGSDLVAYSKDKVATDGSGGTDIASLVKFPEDKGNYEHYKVETEFHSLEMRPETEDTRGDSGYDSNGFLTGTQIDASQYTDGEQTTAQVQALDITPPAYEIKPDRRKDGHRHALEISCNKGENVISGRVSHYVAKDVPEDPDTRKSSENNWQLYINQNLLVWLSRGVTLLKNLVTGANIAGTVTATTGPDGKSNSAMTNTVAIQIAFSAIASGYILAWYKGSQQITGANAFTQIGATTSGSWKFGYVAGPFAIGLILPPGDWYSIRVFSAVGSIDAATRTYVYNDVVNNAGKNTENPW